MSSKRTMLKWLPMLFGLTGLLMLFCVIGLPKRFCLAGRCEDVSAPGETPHPSPEDVSVPGETPYWSPQVASTLLGPLNVDFFSKVSLELTAKANPNVEPGGRHFPGVNVSSRKVAVIIPFRNREEHLNYWLHYLHPILQRQQLDYGVYVINQDGEAAFNRAKLLNIGYAESLKDYDYDCFVFSDVDLIPMDDRNIYSCFSQPRLLSTRIEKFGFQLPYYHFFGGVGSMSKEQFVKVNGFSNSYWGWGGEDDDMRNRIVISGMRISHPADEVARFRNIPHRRDKGNEENPEKDWRITQTRWTMRTDGINSLSYKVVNTTREPLYTNITVSVRLAWSSTQ